MGYDDYIADRSGKDKNFFLTRAEYNRLSKTKSYSYLVNMGSRKRKRGNAFTSNGGARKKRRTRSLARTGGYPSVASYGAGELKFHDVTFSDTSIASGAVFVPTLGSFNVIAGGTGESQRIGRKVTIKKILMKYDIQLNTFAGSTLNHKEKIRMILYVDKQTNGAIATAATILQTTDVRSFRNMENISRYQVLFDKTWMMNVIAAAGDGAVNDASVVMRRGTFFKDCNIPIEYASTTGDIADMRTNNIGMLLVVDQGAIATLNLTCRLRYIG